MGQKVNPIGFRLAVSKDWRSKWYASRQDYPTFLHSDLKIRSFLKSKLHQAAISKIVIERAWNSVRVTLFTARPGLVIGKKGMDIEKINAEISEMSGGKQVKVDIFEVKQPELDAQLIAENIAAQLERRISFRRAMKRSVQTAMDFGALGIRIRCAGRLGGADIARAEWYKEGKVPLQTLRVPIDYGFTEAKTMYGLIGIKCWVNKKEMTEEEANNLRNSRGGDRENRPRRPRNDGPNNRGGGRGRGPGGPGGPGRPGDRSPAPAETAAAPEAEVTVVAAEGGE
jgi:small subunit ribosomal protein S3